MRLAVESLEKSFGSAQTRQRVLSGVDLEVAPGARVAITGESGSGKSTLLHLIGLLDRPDAGEIRFDGEAVSGLNDAGRARLRRERVGLVFQQFNLVPSLTVADNLTLQARLADRHDADWTTRLSDGLGLSDYLKRYPEQLSGGQQQRVAIGRALAARPALVLADEPTGNLDEATSEEVLDLMLALSDETGASLIMATHSQQAAGRLDRRVHLTGGRLS